MQSASRLTALIDVDNFYVSCERLFNPALRQKPVVVLSNNDGCVVARSQEVKDMGIKMGTPYFKIKDLAQRRHIAVFSSNYELYGDISARVMQVLNRFSANTEVYSIDEAFIELNSEKIEETCRQIVQTCQDWVGMPVKIGVSHTKTLAKVAAQLVKQEKTACRYRILTSPPEIKAALGQVELADIWGIGHRTMEKLTRQGIATPLALTAQPENQIRKNFGVVLSRTHLELRGCRCFGIETEPPPQKNLCCSRSFGQEVVDFQELLESVVTHATTASAKLRKRKLKAQSLTVFIFTNRFKQNSPQYANSAYRRLPLPSNDTLLIARQAGEALRTIFKNGYHYKKSGVLLHNLQEDHPGQADLFMAEDTRAKAISCVMDRVNTRYGSQAITLGLADRQAKWQMTRRHQSARFTTQWEELLRI